MHAEMRAAGIALALPALALGQTRPGDVTWTPVGASESNVRGHRGA